MAEAILTATDLVKHYPIKGGVLRRTVGHVKAVDGVSFELYKGETLGIVGESGCGKSTLGRLLMRLEEPTSGSLVFDGIDMYQQKGRAMRRLRRDIQIVFQDPYTSLNPRKTVGDIIGEPFDIHPDVVPKQGRRKKVQELLELVGLSPEHINRYPHQFSGGQRQRIGIARGIALNPKVLICDEPVSALDVSVQAQVVNLMEKLQDELGLSYVFIAHDLSVVRHISDRVGVMYLGKMAEIGDEDQVYSRPTHPYTQALLSAVPVPDPTLRNKREQIVLKGDVPSPANPPSGCRFHTRCFKAQDKCKVDVPELIDRPDGAERAPVRLPLRVSARDHRDHRRLAGAGAGRRLRPPTQRHGIRHSAAPLGGGGAVLCQRYAGWPAPRVGAPAWSRPVLEPAHLVGEAAVEGEQPAEHRHEHDVEAVQDADDEQDAADALDLELQLPGGDVEDQVGARPPVLGLEAHREHDVGGEDQVVDDVGEHDVALAGERVVVEDVGGVGPAEPLDERPEPQRDRDQPERRGDLEYPPGHAQSFSLQGDDGGGGQGERRPPSRWRCGG